MSSLETYTRTAQRAAKAVIDGYSTSFGAATALLGPSHRSHIRNIYALVRIADEVVDGLPRDAGLGAADERRMLEQFIDETHRARETGLSSDLVIHAFAHTARATGIDRDLIDPFFASMRTDLEANLETRNVVRRFAPDEHAEYVFGSAEVVGLMCLRVFLHDNPRSPAQTAELERGARSLGAAFQNINFLRDLADDSTRLGRSYLTIEDRLSASARDEWVCTIRGQLAVAQSTMPMLPADARLAVDAATALFTALVDEIAAAPVERLYRERVRVPNPVKARLLAASALRSVGRVRPVGNWGRQVADRGRRG